MRQFWEFLKKAVGSFLLALVFILVYETARTSFELGEFWFVGFVSWNQPVSLFFVFCFVALLVSLSVIFVEMATGVDYSFWWIPDLSQKKLIGLYVLFLSGLYFLLSPFMSWTLSLFPGPHQNLFNFYWASWQKFDWIDACALLLASSVVGAFVVVTAVLNVAWMDGRAPSTKRF